MALDKNLLKTWFKSMAKPTQSQFWTWIDNIVFKGDKVPVTDVDGLSNTLNSLQLGINALQPNRVVNGGHITIAADDGTNVTIHLEATDYELKGAPFNVAAQDTIITRPSDPTLSRFDVFYLDLTGFHVLKGVESEAPVKPQLLSGLELTTILIGFNNTLETQPMPGTPNLQQVALAGNVATIPIISKDSLQAGQAGTDIVGKIKADGLTADREYQLPDKSGIVAMLDDVTAGTQGPAGESAYQIAVDNGFVGTEAEWLASLQGADGAQGPAGADGAQGPAGADGAPGVGVPVGGALGQILKKKSATDYDTEWADEAAGGGTVDSSASDLFNYYNF